LLLAAHKVYMVELGNVSALVGAPVFANHGNLPETVWLAERELVVLTQIRGFCWQARVMLALGCLHADQPASDWTREKVVGGGGGDMGAQVAIAFARRHEVGHMSARSRRQQAS